jgi:ketosteroid isomerase-like protein
MHSSVTPNVLAALMFCAAVDATAQPADEFEKVKSANRAYYEALSSRDIRAMEQVWSHTSEATNVAPPIRLAAHVGWDAVRKTYEGFWNTLDGLSVSMPQPTIHVKGDVAWVFGIENASRRMKNGQSSSGPNFGTSIFVKEDGRWAMIFHEAALIPETK